VLSVVREVRHEKVYNTPFFKVKNDDFVKQRRAATAFKAASKFKDTGDIVINDYSNAQYYGVIALGTPQQVYVYPFSHASYHRACVCFTAQACVLYAVSVAGLRGNF
jgi:hypothetical protein